MPASNTLQVLAEPSRRAILDELAKGEHAVGELVKLVSQSQPLVSKHLRVLRDAGLVEARPDGQRRLYRVLPKPLEELDAWLATYRHLWSRRIDRLEEHLAKGRNR
jgi:DNA-binding transcriptional ArsR family regulator